MENRAVELKLQTIRGIACGAKFHSARILVAVIDNRGAGTAIEASRWTREVTAERSDSMSGSPDV
jgi:hypothetical protein